MMMELNISEELLGAYLEGKLEGEELVAVEHAIASDPELDYIADEAANLQPLYDEQPDDETLDAIAIPDIPEEDDLEGPMFIDDDSWIENDSNDNIYFAMMAEEDDDNDFDFDIDDDLDI